MIDLLRSPVLPMMTAESNEQLRRERQQPGNNTSELPSRLFRCIFPGNDEQQNRMLQDF